MPDRPLPLPDLLDELQGVFDHINRHMGPAAVAAADRQIARARDTMAAAGLDLTDRDVAATVVRTLHAIRLVHLQIADAELENAWTAATALTSSQRTTFLMRAVAIDRIAGAALGALTIPGVGRG